MGEKGRLATQILTRPDGSAVQLLRKASLKVVKGPDKGKTLAIDRERVVVGADKSCQLVLTDPAISSQHFELTCTAEGFHLRDCDSTNGTYVEGLRLGACTLEGSGATTIRVDYSFIPFGDLDMSHGAALTVEF